MSADLRAQVFEALNNAKDNGYDLGCWHAAEIIEDLKEYDADLESVPAAHLMPHVEAWLEAQR